MAEIVSRHHLGLSDPPHKEHDAEYTGEGWACFPVSRSRYYRLGKPKKILLTITITALDDDAEGATVMERCYVPRGREHAEFVGGGCCGYHVSWEEYKALGKPKKIRVKNEVEAETGIEENNEAA